jgi:SAM-dependent methyltransferase
MSSKLTGRTIDDFGDQWARYTGNDGYYGSPELLADILRPVLEVGALKGKRIAEIGSGTGRIVDTLLAASAEHVTALEPSQAMRVLRDNTLLHADHITYLECRGEELPDEPAQDIVVSIGLLHHIPDPAPVVAAASHAQGVRRHRALPHQQRASAMNSQRACCPTLLTGTNRIDGRLRKTFEIRRHLDMPLDGNDCPASHACG